VGAFDLFAGAFEGKRVLVTGHTGFKGSWLCLWLRQLRASVTGYSLAPPTEPNNFTIANVRAGLTRHVVADVREAATLARAIDEADPHIIYHLAAQPLVRASYRDPVTTVSTNVMGTLNLLEAVRVRRHPCVVIVVTSDKCYENREGVDAYRETDPMGGHDPYSMSKGATELLVSSWRRSFFPPGDFARHHVRLASVRAGNVIGGGDWQQDRLLVDCIRSLEAGQPIEVRNASAVRPWQHVLDALGAYLLLGSLMLRGFANRTSFLDDGWNFGPDASSAWPVARLVDEVVRCWGDGEWRDASDPAAPHEAGLLGLCCDKAARMLGWRPVWDVRRAVGETVAWHRAMAGGADMADVCREQIASYGRDACGLSPAWGRA
jgi:CDP-glucose 4,6-dehydratase